MTPALAMAVDLLHAALLLLPVAAGVSCPLIAHGPRLSVQCSAMDLGRQGVKELGKKVSTLPVDHPAATSLTLDLQHNDVGDDGAELLALGLANCTALTSLVLQADGNSIGDVGIRAFGVAFGKMRSLNSVGLSVRYNQIGSVGLGDLGASLARLEGLRSLTLEVRFNRVDGAGAGSLGASLAKLTKLQFLKLDLYGNSIGGAGASDMAASLGALTNLASLTLDLRYNGIEDEAGRDVRAVLRLMKTTAVTVALPTAPPTTEAPARVPVQHVASQGAEQNAALDALRSELAALRRREGESVRRDRLSDRPMLTETVSSTLKTTTKGRTASIAAATTRPPTSTPAQEVSHSRLRTTVAPDGATQEANEYGSFGAFAVFLWAIAFVAVALFVFMQAQQGNNMEGLLNTASASVREFTASVPQAREYSMNLPDAGQSDAAPEAPILSESHRSQDSFNPDLPTRVDMAAARIAAQRSPPSEASFDDLINQNLSRMQSTDRME